MIIFFCGKRFFLKLSSNTNVFNFIHSALFGSNDKKKRYNDEIIIIKMLLLQLCITCHSHLPSTPLIQWQRLMTTDHCRWDYRPAETRVEIG